MFNLDSLFPAPEDDPDECRCTCHRYSAGVTMHVVPCCRVCPHCRKNIAFTAVNHEQYCSRNPANQPSDEK